MENKKNMMIEVLENDAGKVAIVRSSEVVIATAQDALNLIADVHYSFDCKGIAIEKHCVAEEFFDLRTGLAGDITQKHSNYRMKLAIWGDFSVYDSKSLRDFIYECNNGSTVFFAGDEEEALEMLFNKM